MRGDGYFSPPRFPTCARVRVRKLHCRLLSNEFYFRRRGACEKPVAPMLIILLSVVNPKLEKAKAGERSELDIIVAREVSHNFNK